MSEDEFKNVTLEELEKMYTKEEVGDFVLDLISKNLKISKAEALRNFGDYKCRITMRQCSCD